MQALPDLAELNMLFVALYVQRMLVAPVQSPPESLDAGSAGGGKGAAAGRRAVRVRLGAPGDVSEEELEEEPERPGAGREARWERIAQAAVKQSLRCGRRCASLPSHSLCSLRLDGAVRLARKACLPQVRHWQLRCDLHGWKPSHPLAAAALSGSLPLVGGQHACKKWYKV
jgi:hypothetical protein